MLICGDVVLLDKDYLLVANYYFLNYPEMGLLGQIGMSKSEIG